MVRPGEVSKGLVNRDLFIIYEGAISKI